MSSQVSDLGLKEAIVHSVENGAYPESEDVSSAELPASVLPALLVDIQRARDEVKADIRQLSREVAPDVDGWISQAKKLQADIEHSKATARDIVQRAEAGAKLKADADDAANKARLLEKEVSFNKALFDTLGQIKTISHILSSSQEAMIQGDHLSALARLKEADSGIPKLSVVQHTRAYELIKGRNQELKTALAERATAKARQLVEVSVPDRRLTVGSSNFEEIGSIVDTLDFLEARALYIKRLKRELDSAIIQPWISANGDKFSTIHTNNNTISVSGAAEPGALNMLDDTWTLMQFLHTHLPANVCSPLSEILLPQFMDDLITLWLDPCVPIDVDEMPAFQQVLDRVSKLTDQIDTLQWPASLNMLREWVRSAPKTWHAKRRETALGLVRNLLFTKLKETKTVERVETQMVSKGDALIGGGEDAEDDAWDAAWEEDEAPSAPLATKTPVNSQPMVHEEDDDDEASAWGLDDDEPDDSLTTNSNTTSIPPKSHADANTDVDADAWGWGDDEAAAQEDPGQSLDDRAQQTPTRESPVKGPVERELTLRETYTVTAVPDGILEIVMQSVTDAVTLTDPSYTHTPIGPAASALYTLPTFALAMYRATAATAYGKLDSGNMLIYNDGTRLADQLRSFLKKQSEQDKSSALAPQQRPSSRLKLENDLKALETFSRRSYSTEMESQRTILNDMLDGAQGFISCTVEPYASACESAIEITASRLRDVHRQWEPILSRSALQQSLGSLLGTVTSKMIIDVQDLSDIGEEESKQLKSFCDKLSEVKELFVEKHPDSGKHSDMTGIYCPNWFKFQYLAEILESSLADIKYLWIDGELRLEFDAEEVIDLVQALFADSDYRRKAIADIRRAAR